MRKKVAAGNWKMNKTPKEGYALAKELAGIVDTKNAEVIFCVPSISISEVKKALEGTDIYLGAQNMYFEESGAFTGEISPLMLKDCGVSHVILGHSERRSIFKEDDALINKKVISAAKYGLIPILCVGETLEERESGRTMEVIKRQVTEGLKNFKKDSEIILAYEPVWAIGTGKTATDDQAQEVCAEIRKLISVIFDKEKAENTRILYGGSVNGKNAAKLFAMPDIDGGLVGGASLKAEFAEITRA